MTGLNAVPSILDDEAVVGALRGLRAAEHGYEAARRCIRTAKDEMALALRQAAAAYRDEDLALPVDVIAHLYWERPEVRAQDIASAFGVSVTRLAALAGPRTEVTGCSECGGATEAVRRSRSDGIRYTTCDDCRRRRDEEQVRQRLEDLLQEERERARWEGGGAWDPYGGDRHTRPYPLP
jgi:hypothetical protein